jgi:Zn-dependent protease with chaperone function
MALVCVSCAAPESKLPELPKDAVAAEQRAQQIAQLRRYYGERHRVDSVAFRIRTANVADCKNRIAPQIGLTAMTPRSLPRKYQSYTSEALRIGWTRPTAISVVEGSPAAQAGIMAGDHVIALNDEAVPLWGITRWINRRLLDNGTAPIKFNIRRDGVDRVVTVTPVMGCSIPIQYIIDETSNASASHTKIVIHSGIVALTETDADLAMIIGHELAHSNLGHLHKKEWNMMLGMAAGSVIDIGLMSGGISTNNAFAKQFAKFGVMAYSVNFEREADYVGSYYTARAGYELKGIENFWRRAAMSDPNSILLARTHPISATRYVQIQKVREEIEDKKRLGLPLDPTLNYVAVEHAESDSTADSTADDAPWSGYLQPLSLKQTFSSSGHGL